jgi:hypothetical protein
MNKHNIKHLYVTGDSFSFGQGLKGHDVNDFYKFTPELRKTSYSGIIADTWGIPLTNTSLPGGSNDRVLRLLMIDIPKLLKTVSPDQLLVNISYTHASRTEFYSTESKTYTPVITNFEPRSVHFKSHNEIWKTYVTYFDDVREHVDRHLRNLISMQQFLASLGVKYLISRSMQEFQTFHNELARDVNRKPLIDLIDKKTFPEDLPPFNMYVRDNNLNITPCHHTDEGGHRAWAEHLMKYMTEKEII